MVLAVRWNSRSSRWPCYAQVQRSDVIQDRDDRRCRDQIMTERSVATALVNAAYRAVAFTGSAPEPDKVLTCLGLRSRNLPF
ncbi:hypothetical protein Taro_041159 [Colocasia esculenta]|uniref:Uncharacterized protein n=1 Tax=Colocasia esculenta TaxID=4460 RepID=A0A843WWI6_COLES|nr:hypothetical protein [Colocasia esculenta]